MNRQLNIVKSTDLELARDEVHIWSAFLDRTISPYHSLLVAGERKRAGRFHFEKERNRFIVRRGILRILLGCYLGVEPERVLFSYGKNDKPALADDFNRKKIHFNLSHSEGLAIYAFIRNREIGIDIERIRDMPEMDQIAMSFFSPGENEVFRILPESGKRQAFFNCWTRKEAFIKATGDGLSYPLDKFDVSLARDEPARLVSIEGDSEAAARWSICDLNVNEGYQAAFVKEGQYFEPVYFEWEP